METPQEIEVWYIIPSIRKELAKAYKEAGLSQSEIAKKMGLTPAAVSQYINKKRGKEAILPPIIIKEIKKSAKRTKKSRSRQKVMDEIQRICRIIRKKGILCKVHRKHSSRSLRNCKICFKR